MEPLTSTRYHMLNVKAVWTRLDMRCIVAYTHVRSQPGVLLYSLRESNNSLSNDIYPKITDA